MLRRREMARQVDKRVSIDAPISESGGDDELTIGDALPGEAFSLEAMDEDWRQAVLASAKEHVLTKTALSQRDKDVYREYSQEGRPIEVVAAKYRISRNLVSQIKTRIDRRIVAVGQEFLKGLENV